MLVPLLRLHLPRLVLLLHGFFAFVAFTLFACYHCACLPPPPARSCHTPVYALWLFTSTTTFGWLYRVLRARFAATTARARATTFLPAALLPVHTVLYPAFATPLGSARSVYTRVRLRWFPTFAACTTLPLTAYALPLRAVYSPRSAHLPATHYYACLTFFPPACPRSALLRSFAFITVTYSSSPVGSRVYCYLYLLCWLTLPTRWFLPPTGLAPPRLITARLRYGSVPVRFFFALVVPVYFGLVTAVCSSCCYSPFSSRHFLRFMTVLHPLVLRCHFDAVLIYHIIIPLQFITVPPRFITTAPLYTFALRYVILRSALPHFTFITFFFDYGLFIPTTHVRWFGSVGSRVATHHPTAFHQFDSPLVRHTPILLLLIDCSFIVPPLPFTFYRLV